MLSSANKTRILDKNVPYRYNTPGPRKFHALRGATRGKRSCYLPGDIKRAIRTIIRAAGRCVNLLGLQTHDLGRRRFYVVSGLVFHFGGIDHRFGLKQLRLSLALRLAEQYGIDFRGIN
jgi:hypothetical protein